MIFSAGLIHVARTAPAPVTAQPVADRLVPPSGDTLMEATSPVTAMPAPAAVTDNRKLAMVQPNQGDRPKVQTYKVEAGDTVEAIAERFGLEVSTILWANDLLADDVLQIDQELTIPAVNGVVHKVAEGDTLWDLQESFGADYDAIVKANPDVDPTILQPGQVLLIPGGQPATRRMVASSRGASRPSVSGQLDVWPTVGPLTDPFGSRVHPVYGTRHFHDGMDIGVGVGTPIRAASAGTVVMAEWYGGYGKVVRIDHGGGVVTQYSHLSSIEVDYGQKVDAGETIAYSGNTGVSTGPHLHFSVLVGGSPVDPMPWLP